MKRWTPILLLTLVFSCGQRLQFTFFLENTLNEKVKIEGFYIPFNHPTQPIKSGELTIMESENLLIGNYSVEPRSTVFATDALRTYLKISSVDSLVMTFENGEKIHYLITERDNSLNPLDITNWVDETGVGTAFEITQAHRDAAN